MVHVVGVYVVLRGDSRVRADAVGTSDSIVRLLVRLLVVERVALWLTGNWLALLQWLGLLGEMLLRWLHLT